MLEHIQNIIGIPILGISAEILFAMCIMIIILLCDRFFSIIEYIIHLFGGLRK